MKRRLYVAAVLSVLTVAGCTTLAPGATPALSNSGATGSTIATTSAHPTASVASPPAATPTSPRPTAIVTATQTRTPTPTTATQTRTPTPTKAVVPVLGAPDPGASSAQHCWGLGEVKPSTFGCNGGLDHHVDGVSWSSWGGATATGTGEAGYIPKGELGTDRAIPAAIRAWDLGTCRGKLAYRQLKWWFPSEGQSFESGGITYYISC